MQNDEPQQLEYKNLKTDEPFMSAGSHWNSNNKPYSNHTANLLVLFSNHGRAILSELKKFRDSFCLFYFIETRSV